VATTDRLAVSFVFSRECPSHEEGLALLRSAARQAGVGMDLRIVEVTSDAQARALRFTGSPTYLLGGEDPFGAVTPAHDFQHDACRAYALPGGRIGPLPRHDDLVAALRAAVDDA
jgi:hypothetical protein